MFYKQEHDIQNPPGQIDNSKELDKLAYKNNPKTLGDVIDNVLFREQQLTKKKLSFEEWYYTIKPSQGRMPFPDWFTCMQEAWKAGQENV